VKVNCIYPQITSGVYKWPFKEDCPTVEKFIFSMFASPPYPVSGGRSYSLEDWEKFSEMFQAYQAKYFREITKSTGQDRYDSDKLTGSKYLK